MTQLTAKNAFAEIGIPFPKEFFGKETGDWRILTKYLVELGFTLYTNEPMPLEKGEPALLVIKLPNSNRSGLLVVYGGDRINKYLINTGGFKLNENSILWKNWHENRRSR